MEGKITRLTVTYAVKDGDDAEQVEDLLDDLAVICEDIAAAKMRRVTA